MAKIRSVQAYPLAYPEPHYKGIERYITLARVESEDGLVGWGECISQFREASLATKVILEQGFAPLLVGDNALDTERLWRKMLDHAWWYGPEGIAAFAVSAVDMALWDLKGKVLGVPVSRALGGQLHDRVVAMASFIFDMEDVDWTLGEFRWLCEQGEGGHPADTRRCWNYCRNPAGVADHLHQAALPVSRRWQNTLAVGG